MIHIFGVIFRIIIDTYNLDLDRIDRKEYPKEDSESTFYDIAEVQNNQFAIIFNKQQKEETTKELWLVKLETNEITELDNSLNKYLNSQVLSLEDGFILYGITKEVKLKKGEASYYIIKYNKEGTIEWESIGNIPINIKGPIKIKNQKNQFFVLYENEDNSKEVIVLNQDGTYSQSCISAFPEASRRNRFQVFTRPSRRISGNLYEIASYRAER